MAEAPAYTPQINDDLGEDGQVKGFDFNDKTIRRSFIRKVYSILMCQLLITVGFIALFLYHAPTRMLVERNPTMIIYSFITVMVTVIVMACFEAARRRTPANFIFLSIFTLAEGFMLGVFSCQFDSTSVIIAIGITAALCLALTLFAFQTKYDFTMMGGFLLCALIVLIIFGVVSIFIARSELLNMVYASVGALLFSLYLVYDTQLMMGGNHKYTISPEEYVFAALNIYLDVVNIFLYILRLIGGR